MRSEARLAAPLLALPWVMGIEIGGGQSAGGLAAARQLIGHGADGLLSFGLAAGLVDAAPAGTLLCPDEVVVDGQAYPVDPALASRLAARGNRQPLLHSSRVVTSAARKRALAAGGRFAGLDMESGMVAEAASAAGIGFAVLRAVCDPVSRDLPDAAAQALDAGGGVAMVRLGLAVLRRPTLIGALIALGGDAARARRALGEAVRRIAGPTGSC